MTVLSNLPVVRSGGARALFLASAAITTVLMLWANSLANHRAGVDLSHIFFLLFSSYDYTGAISLLLILIGAALIPRLPAARILRWSGEHPLSISGCSLVVLCVGALTVYHDHPLSMDEYSQFFQSQVFAAGHLSGRFPVPLIDWLIPQGFQNYFLFVSHRTGAVVSAYWPSFALLLTPFTWAGIPWACNPVISAATLLVVHRLAREIYHDVEAAGAALLLTVASPVFFANGISYYSMPAHLLANSIFALLLLKPTGGRCLAAGIVGSIALTLHNPVPHLLFAVPWLLWLARRPDAARPIGCLIAGYLPLCLLLGVGWFRFCMGVAHDDVSAEVSSHGLIDGLQRVGEAFALPSWSVLVARAIGVAKIWLWSTPGLVLLAGVGAWRWRRNEACRLLTISAVLTLLGYMLVPLDQGHGWGFRYFHSAWMTLPILAAGALLPARVNEIGAKGFEEDRVRVFVVACALLSLCAGVGFRALQMHKFIAEDLAQVPSYAGHGKRVVLLDGAAASYQTDLIQNDPWLRGDTITMLGDGRQENALMMHQYFPQMRLVYDNPFGEVWLAPQPDP